MTTFNDYPDLLKQVIIGNESWVHEYDSKTKPRSSKWKRPEEPKPKKALEVRSNVKVLFTIFFDCNGMVIMNSCHKVVRSVKNTALKLYGDCAKQFVRNAQNCGKTNNGFCTMIKHQLTHRFLYVSFWPKIKS